jgi:hypothetical protein
MAPKSPRLQAELERIGRERLAASREADRAMRRELLRVCAECFGSCAVGLVLAAFAFHTTDRDMGEIFLFGGMLINIVGVTLSLIRAYQRGVERGDW